MKTAANNPEKKIVAVKEAFSGQINGGEIFIRFNRGGAFTGKTYKTINSLASSLARKAVKDCGATTAQRLQVTIVIMAVPVDENGVPLDEDSTPVDLESPQKEEETPGTEENDANNG